MEAALREVQEFFGNDRIARVALDENYNVLGWIGGIKHNNGNVWEIHPLTVRPGYQRKGIGRAVVHDFEDHINELGGLTLWVGTDDENNLTTLSSVDLYENFLEKISKIQKFKGHPFEFYQKLGFVIVGVIPDANRPGKPDIYMAKRVNRR
jgi:aminoglycoside 6'-N-acetyltransferase I